MADIKRISASAEAIESAKKASFVASSYLIPDGVNLTIKEATFTSHEVDGVDKKTAVPILVVLHGTEEKVLYLRSFLSTKMDYKGESVDVGGSFNEHVKSLMGKTIGEVIDDLNTHKGAVIKAKIVEYRGVNRLGDIQTISINSYDKVGW
jgi:stage V sporulation protein SpoVS